MVVLGTLRSSKTSPSKLLLYRPKRSSTQGQCLVRWSESLPEVDGISPTDWAEVVCIELMEKVLAGFTPVAGLLLPVIHEESMDTLLGCTSEVWQRWLQRPRHPYAVATADWHRAVMDELNPKAPASEGDEKESAGGGREKKRSAASETSSAPVQLVCIGPGFMRKKVSTSAVPTVDKIRSLLSGAACA